MPAIDELQKPVSEKRMALMAYLLLTVAYVASGKLGLMLALPPGYASLVFPPAGIAIAAAFVSGRKTLPWIFLGSLVLNVWVGYTSTHRIALLDIEAAVIIAIASMLQAALAGWGLRRIIGHADTLNNLRDILLFLSLTPLACVTSATLSVSGLWALGIIGAPDLAAQWFSWWFGDTLGVVVIFPLMLALLGEPRTLRFVRVRVIVLPVLLVLATGFLAVYFLQQAAINTARHVQQEDFDYQGREIALRIEQRLDSYAQVLRGARGLYVASQRVGRNEFRDFVSSLELERRYPGIQGVGFSLIVRPDEMARHIASMRREGFSGYTPFPPGKREFHTVVVYIEPFSGRNLRAFGYDMYSDSVRRAAMEQARDLGKSVMSGKVMLVQETKQDVQAGFLMYLPVYRNGKPHETLVERRANIIGWVYAPFRMNDLMDGILGEQVHNIDFEIYDDANVGAETLIYDSRADRGRVGEQLFRYTKQIETKGRQWTINLHSLPAFEANIDTGRITIIRASGLLISVLLSLVVWQLAAGRARALRLAQDITSELRHSEEQLREAQRVAHLGSWEEDLTSHRLIWSDEMYHIFERDPTSFQPSYEAVLDTIHPDDRILVDSAFKESVANRSPWSVEHRLLMADGRVKYVRAKGETSFDERDQVLRGIGAVQDITEQKLAQKRIERMAHYDTLTNLPNRALFYDRLRQAIHVARRTKSGLTLLFMDLDGFKEVNDTMGHHAGDLLLIGVAERLSGCVRESDTVSRLGGDEFTIILGGMHKQEDVIAEAQKIIQSIAVPFDLEGSKAVIGISIGIARYTEEADNEDALVSRADEAMYAAKSAGKNTYRIASAD
ncbi:MAG: CHASE domain-containing protein [Betaproteobacteria bacterium]|nr:CHASE domain-containing protein [Betaproteobacteria bacterium]